MKTALLHYWLTNMRGGERVIEEFCRLWPEADIFTHAYAPDKMSETINRHKVYCSFINQLPGAAKHCQKYLPLMPSAIKKLNLDDYELIISSESGPIKGIRKASGATHICYCHTPMRYLWDMYEDYYRETGPAGKLAMRVFKNYLRKYDLNSADSVDHFIANSHFVAERIKRIYKRDAAVIHPPVLTDFFSETQAEKQDYYLFVGQLISYKRPDLAMQACIKMKRRIVIVGDGPMRDKLETQAAGNADVIFEGRPSYERLRELYAGAQALLFPGIEDFGIVPLEAQAAGTPVIALGIGGALETVAAGKTGLFFNEEKITSLCQAIEEFEATSFLVSDMKANAQKFNAERFRKQMCDFVSAHLNK